MARLRPAVLAVALLAVAAPLPAHADGATYKGGCAFGVVNDTTPGALLGGQETWHGEVHLAVVPIDAAGLPSGGTVTAWCSLTVNGVDQGPVLGPVTGIGAVAAAKDLSYTAAVSDPIFLCTHVTTASGTEVACETFAVVPVVPRQVTDLVYGLLTTTNPTPFEIVDAVDCPVFSASEPVVDAVAPDAVFIDPTGDVYAGGTMVYDCPPYAGG